MKATIVAFGILILNTCAREKPNEFSKFVKSFPNIKTETVSFEKLAQIQTPMSKDEALKYVYPNNPDRLTCDELAFDLETEKSIDTTISEYLPGKVMKRALPEGYLIGLTNYNCSGEQDMIEIKLILITLNKSFTPKDTLVAYIGNEFSNSVGGLLSPNTNIFLITKNQKREFFASLYKIEPRTLKFQRLKNETPISASASDYLTTIKNIQWESDFIPSQ